MMAHVIDQELIVHLFVPTDGPQADTAYRQVSRLWSACREQLGTTEPIRGIRSLDTLPPARAGLPLNEIIAAQESPAADRQVLLRRVHDVLNLSVAVAQPAGTPAERRLGWAEQAQIWAQASASGTGAALGEVRLFLARAPAGNIGTVAATAALGRDVETLLPYREDRQREWWRWGVTTSAGYAVWDTRPADTGAVREIVVIAAADRDAELSAWAWSDGTASFPPFARYLMHVAKLRYEARLLDSWEHTGYRGDIDRVLAELGVALAPDAPHPDKAELLRSRLSRLRAEENRLNALEADLERLAKTVLIAQDNMSSAIQREAGGGGTGMFAEDLALAGWLSRQVDDDLGYVQVDLEQTRRARELADAELKQTPQAEPPADASALSARSAGLAGRPASADQAQRRVFVVHGRDMPLTHKFFDLLHAVDLRPMEWETLVQATGNATPYLGEVVGGAPHLAQATLVLLTPDDIVELHPDLCQDDDAPHEQARSMQARPNVLFELGLALMAYPRRTIVLEIGRMRPLSDLAGLNVIRFDGSAASVQKLLSRLKAAGCPVDDSGSSWLDPDRFADLRRHQRDPDSRDVT